MVKLTKMAAFEIVLPKNSREAGIQAGSRTASYNQMESTLQVTSYDILKAEKGLKSITCSFTTKPEQSSRLLIVINTSSDLSIHQRAQVGRVVS